MVKAIIDRVEIERILTDEYGCKLCEWDVDGNAIVEVVFDRLKKKPLSPSGYSTIGGSYYIGTGTTTTSLIKGVDTK